MNLADASSALHLVRVAVRDPRELLAAALRELVARMTGFAVADDEAAEPPDLVLVGVPSPPDCALEMVLSLRRSRPELPIVLLADVPDSALVAFVLDYGLNGLLLTDSTAPDLAACLRQVSKGNAVLPAHWQHLAAPAPVDPLEGLSTRQRDVLELLAEGLSYEEIAARLFISANTVKFHVRGIFVRLGVRNRTAASRFVARRQGGAGWHVSTSA